MSSKRKSKRRQKASATPSFDVVSDESLAEEEAEWGLRPSVQRSLLQDIEEQGGLDVVDLASLCNAKPDVYGLPRSPLRRKVQNKVDRWKTKSSSEFDAIKRNLGVTSAPASNEETGLAKTRKDAEPRNAQKQQKSSKSSTKKAPVTKKKPSFGSVAQYAKKSSGTNDDSIMDNLEIDRAYIDGTTRPTLSPFLF